MFLAASVFAVGSWAAFALVLSIKKENKCHCTLCEEG